MPLADRNPLSTRPATPPSTDPSSTGERFTPCQVRRLGGVLVVIGTLLMLAMAGVLYALAPTLMHPGQLIGGERFTGTAEQARHVLELLVSVLVGGLVFVGVGVHQWATGRRNPWLLAIAGLAILAIFWLGRQAHSALL